MKKDTITAAVLLCALGAGFLGCVFHTDRTYSLSERRKLAQRPAVTVAALADGSYAAAFEKFAPDQFPLRETFRNLKARVQYRILQQKDNNGVYQVDGSFSKLEAELNEESVRAAGEKFNALREQYFPGSAVYYGVIPDKNYYLAAANGYPHLDYDRLDEILDGTVQNMTRIDLADCLSIEDYYKTDSHWRQERLEKVARRIGDTMGVGVAPFSGYHAQSRADFRGVYWGQSALQLPAEALYYLTDDTLEQCTVHHFETGEDTGVYEVEELEGKDPYNVFLGGADALLTITNPGAKSGRELILFRDSFGSSLAPLLVQDYQTVTLVDLRYVSSQILDQYIDFHGQDVLFLYSPSVYNSSAMLK